MYDCLMKVCIVLKARNDYTLLNYCYKTASKVLLSLVETVFKSLFQSCLLNLALWLVKQLMLFSCQATVTTVMSTCPQLMLDLMSGIPKNYI